MVHLLETFFQLERIEILTEKGPQFSSNLLQPFDLLFRIFNSLLGGQEKIIHLTLEVWRMRRSYHIWYIRDTGT